jgi:ribosomal protein L15E
MGVAEAVLFPVVVKVGAARAVMGGVSSTQYCGLPRSGARWRDLPEDRFGPYQTIKRRYYRWIEQGIFDQIFEAVAADPDMEWLSIDATVIRAQAQAAGGLRKRGERKPRLSAVPVVDLAARSML